MITSQECTQNVQSTFKIPDGGGTWLVYLVVPVCARLVPDTYFKVGAVFDFTNFGAFNVLVMGAPPEDLVGDSHRLYSQKKTN